MLDDAAEAGGGDGAGEAAAGDVPGPGDVAGPEDHFAGPLVDPLVSFPEGRQLEGQVGVGEGDHPAGGRSMAVRTAQPLPRCSASRMVENGSQAPGQLGGAVAAAVVCDDNAVVDTPMVEEHPQLT